MNTEIDRSFPEGCEDWIPIYPPESEVIVIREFYLWERVGYPIRKKRNTLPDRLLNLDMIHPTLLSVDAFSYVWKSTESIENMDQFKFVVNHYNRIGSLRMMKKIQMHYRTTLEMVAMLVTYPSREEVIHWPNELSVHETILASKIIEVIKAEMAQPCYHELIFRQSKFAERARDEQLSMEQENEMVDEEEEVVEEEEE